MIKGLGTINTKLIPIPVMQDVKHRISDWIASGGKETDPYIQRQFDYLKAVEKVTLISKEMKQSMKAREKYTPKKVLYEEIGYDRHHDVNLYACICPSCGLHIIEFTDDDVDSKCDSDNPEDMFRSSMVHHAYIGLNNFCNRCGQRLKWEDGD